MEITALVATAIVLVALGGGGWWLRRHLTGLRRENDRLGRELQQLQQHLSLPGPSRNEEFSSGDAGAGTFAATLDYAGLKMRLQGGDRGGEIPERYRLLTAMVRRGLVSSELAEVLKISPAEAEQLLRLASLSTSAPPSPSESAEPRVAKKAPRKRRVAAREAASA